MKYVRLCSKVAERGILVSETEVNNKISSEKEWYTSPYFYNEEHFKQFQKTNSVRGIKDVTANSIWWDFDDESDPTNAQNDAKELLNRLSKFNIKDPEIYFSGNKGFHVVIQLNTFYTPKQVEQAAVKIAEGLKTFDFSLYDHAQIFRVAGTKNMTTGLYKIPLTTKELNSLSIPQIKLKATDLGNISEDFEWHNQDLPQELFQVKQKEKKELSPLSNEVNYKDKPAHWKEYKWAIAQGFFDAGERHQALMVLAATCRGLGYDKETTYYMCKAALKKQAARTGTDEFPKEELWNNIIEDSIFSDNWEGGQYSPKTNSWLASYCEKMGIKVEEEQEANCIEVMDMEKQFTSYAQNFEQNIIKTGIKGIDENVLFLASTHNGLLGAPGAGKTAFSLEYLRNSSLQGISSVFLSLDMGLPMIYSKLVQRATGMSFKQVMDLYRNEPKKAAELTARIKEDYKNVSFNFKSGTTVADMKNIIKNEQERTGKPVKLLVTDYLECIAGPYSDATANTGFICNQLKDLANELNVCSLLLLQTQKHSTGDISDPLLSMRQIKGSSIIEQSCSVVLTLWREGYSPKTVDDDKYISFATVKNRFGSLWTDDFGFNGREGSIHGLTEEERIRLSKFKDDKLQAKLAAEKEGNKRWE